MKKTFILAVVLCNFCTVYAQEDYFDKAVKQAVAIDSLKKEIKRYQEQISLFQRNSTDFQNKIKALQRDFAEITKFKQEKQDIQLQLRQKDEHIHKLQIELSTKDTQLSEKYEEGKQVAFSNIIDGYRGKSFDDLIRSTTKWSVQRDLSLVGNKSEIKRVLSDLEKYFNAKALLEEKFNTRQIEDAKKQLQSIIQDSQLLDQLKENIEQYQNFTIGLKERIERIIALDNSEGVFSAGEDVKKQKHYKILSEISRYIFNYDFNFTDYPYLSHIVLEIFKRKQPNPDADVSDLLNKVNF
jgi:hypothetical protein